MNIGIFIAFVAFSILKNNYYGWNVLPQSDSELICDGISILIFSMGLISFRIERKKDES